MNRVRETVVRVDGSRVSLWTDGVVFTPPSRVDLYLEMTDFAEWEKPEAAVRIKVSCPTIGGHRQLFEKEYRRADLTKYDQKSRRALIAIQDVVGTDSSHKSANSIGKHELRVTIESVMPKRIAEATCDIEVLPNQ